MLLYCDDFQPYTTRKGSAGGCYMLPLGVKPIKCSWYGAVRVLGLAPPGISTNLILSEFIKDIVKGSTQGFASFDADGSPITIFLDIVGFIGDYPAVTHVNDLLGHTACSPCHICTFQREDGSGTGASRYAYTSRIHARAPSFVRTMERMKELRSTNLSPVSLRELGLNANISEAHLTLHRLAEALNKVLLIYERENKPCFSLELSHIQFIKYSLHIVDIFHISCHDISIVITSLVTRTTQIYSNTMCRALLLIIACVYRHLTVFWLLLL
jgi:hypothetical protein